MLDPKPGDAPPGASALPRPCLLGRALRHAARALGLGRRPLDLVYSRAYRIELPATAADPLRGERILSFLLGAGLAAARRVHAPEPASFQQLRRVHDEGYLESLPRPGALAKILGFDLPDPFPDRVLAAQRAMTGGPSSPSASRSRSGASRSTWGAGSTTPSATAASASAPSTTSRW